MKIYHIYRLMAVGLVMFFIGCHCDSCGTQPVCKSCEHLDKKACECKLNEGASIADCGEHGTPNDFCVCDCDSGWSGPDCTIPPYTNPPLPPIAYLKTKITPSFGNPFQYHTYTVDFELRDGTAGADTVVIDAYHGEEDWVYFEIYKDISSLAAPIAIPLDATQGFGSAFGSYKDKNTGEIYHTDQFISGDTLYLDVFSRSPLRIKGRFKHNVSYPFTGQYVALENGEFTNH